MVSVLFASGRPSCGAQQQYHGRDMHRTPTLSPTSRALVGAASPCISLIERKPTPIASRPSSPPTGCSADASSGDVSVGQLPASSSGAMRNDNRPHIRSIAHATAPTTHEPGPSSRDQTRFIVRDWRLTADSLSIVEGWLLARRNFAEVHTPFVANLSVFKSKWCVSSLSKRARPIRSGSCGGICRNTSSFSSRAVLPESTVRSKVHFGASRQLSW